jgi:hypothetical protein
MSIRVGILLCVVAVTVVLAASADAKCGFQRYRVELEIRSSRTGEPVSGVRLAAFANQSEVEMLSGTDGNPISTELNGKLARTYLLNTYSGAGILHAERCDAKLRALEIVVIHPDYRARRISVKNILSSPAGNVDTIVMSPVHMDPLQP